MQNKLVVVTDLGCLKAYKVDYDEFSTSPRLELIKDMQTAEADGRLSDKNTDGEGRFKKGGALGMGTGGNVDPNNMELELERRAITQLAKTVNQLVKSNDGDRPVYLAAIKRINNQLMDKLDPGVRARIEKNVSEDLTKINGTKLLGHFA
ncbi:host attachment protein [Pedosphaera parvula]|uniref:Host attachment protein n=1 Tax=Pedosphaera parvula (strain Ellin514) TaxID=320771 RepID=B9XPZ6_PEDPL|nr:host attachment protein [Pedosphaera parvula]EEF58093.1 hypothetical protein Cflav_PD1332 [Pedosphaera parvula Ellin514]